MPTLTQSQTFPMNPSSSTPQLTLSEIWEVLLLKCRKPQLFVAAFSSCTVLEETPTSMKRRAVFKEGLGPPGGEVVEDLEIRGPWKIDFYNRTTGAFVNNTVSQGKDETDLYLTFYFEWPYPNLEEGSTEAKETEKKLWGMAREVVQHTIDVAREMARDGKLGKGIQH